MKIGIITVHHFINYGSALQAYAMQEAVNRMGADAEIIDYEPICKDDYLKTRLRRNWYKLLSPKKWFKYFREKYYLNKIHFAEIEEKRKEKYKTFHAERFHLSKLIQERGELSVIEKRYDAVVCGSDQIWNPTYIKHDMSYYLDFVSDSNRRIAYAPSVAVTSFPGEYEQEIKEQLVRFPRISVRENESVALIEGLSGKKVQAVVDPTLLLTKEAWKMVIKPTREYSTEEPYILCYFLGDNQEYRKYVDCLKRMTGLRVLLIPHMYFREIKAFYDYGDVNCNAVGPSEFLFLIQNASYICTDSFHGTVFSLIFEKKFFTFKRYLDDSKSSENSRIYTLLDMVNCTDRLISSEREIEKIYGREMDYVNIKERIEQRRQESIRYFMEELDRVKAANS